MVENHGELVIWDQGNPSVVEFFQRKINRYHFLVLKDIYSEWRFEGEQERVVGGGSNEKEGFVKQSGEQRGIGKGTAPSWEGGSGKRRESADGHLDLG